MKRTKPLDLPYVPFSAPRPTADLVNHVHLDERCRCCIWAWTTSDKCHLAVGGQLPPQWETEETCPYQEALLPRVASRGA